MTKKETLDRGEGKTVESPTGEQALQNHADKLANEVSALGVEDENASKVAQQIREAASSGDRGFLSQLAHDYKMVAPFIAALIAFVPWFKEQRVEANEDGHLTQVKSGEEKLSYDAKDIARLTGLDTLDSNENQTYPLVEMQVLQAGADVKGSSEWAPTYSEINNETGLGNRLVQQIREIIVQHPGFEHSITVTRIGGTASPEGQKTKNIVLAKKRAETAWTNDVGPTLAKEFGLDFNLPDGLDIDGQINEDLTGGVNQMAQDLGIRLTDNRGRKKSEAKLKQEVDSQIRRLRQSKAKHEIFAKLDASRYVEVEVQVQLTREVKHGDPGKIKPDPKLPEIYIIKLRAKVDEKTMPNPPKGEERVLPPGAQIGRRNKEKDEAKITATNKKTKARGPVTKQRAIGLHAGAGSIGGQGRGPGNRIR